jgi:hypothetical protein
MHLTTPVPQGYHAITPEITIPFYIEGAPHD